jgi:hypothetical protein
LYGIQKIFDVLLSDILCFQCSGHVNDVARRDNLVRFKFDRLPTFEGWTASNRARELMRRALFEHWLIDHP